MPSASANAQATAPASSSLNSQEMPSPLENLSLQETLRVMDVAREMRDRRETAEEMFRRDDLRASLREKLLRTARLSGDTVTEAEIDAAIRQYMDTLHVFQEPAPGMSRFMAHCWVWRNRIMAGAAAAATVVGAYWFLFA
ncbi:hypothetical protein Poly51_16120 [Rubripirellula tenax]|uniref:Uncharacterized protein n=1 Tax=Rubripirellula tenax TaxID=2528015 RepID=A0A5C6FDL2_9BACT|nr:DUF6384 family protein [Rubripirellula tenax]TWU58832.1 hypothetical protein Poly51_16120 [Rubripirellula tenax]